MHCITHKPPKANTRTTRKWCQIRRKPTTITLSNATDTNPPAPPLPSPNTLRTPPPNTTPPPPSKQTSAELAHKRITFLAVVGLSCVASAAHREFKNGLIRGTTPATKDNTPARLCSCRRPMTGLLR